MRVIPRHTASTGITSRRLRSLLGNCRKYVPKRYESAAEVLIPSFHPRNGCAVELSTIAGRTMARGRPVPSFVSNDSARPFVSVYVFGQPNSRARLLPASVSSFRSQRTRSEEHTSELQS